MSSPLKIDSLLAEFVGALIFLKSIPPGIDEADCDPEEDIHLVKRLLYDNSLPRPPEEIAMVPGFAGESGGENVRVVGYGGVGQKSKEMELQVVAGKRDEQYPLNRKGITTESDVNLSKKLVHVSNVIHPDPDKPVRIEFMINGNIFYVIEQEIQEYWDKEEKMKKAAKEARLLAMSKPKVIKVVQEEAEKIELDPNKISTTKAGSSQSSRRKRKRMKLEPEVKVPGLECNRSLPEGVPFFNNMIIEELNMGSFSWMYLDEDEREPMFIQPHDPDYVPEPMYPKYIPLEIKHVLPAKEQPLPPVNSATAELPGYVAESDPEEDPEEDDADDKDEDEEDEEEEEEEEHLASANAGVVVPTVKPITIRHQASMSLPPEAEVERLIAMPTPPPSPLTSLSPPFALIDAVIAALHSPPLPPLPPTLYIPPPIDRRDDIPETELPPRKKSCLFALGPREVGYGIRDAWVDPEEAVPKIAPMTLGEVNTRVTELAELHEHDTQDLYALLKDAQDSVCTRVLDPGTSDTTIAAGRIMAPVTRRGQNTPPNETNPNNMTLEFIQAMIDQALLRNSTNGDESHRAALNWWNGKIRTLGPDAYTMTWEILKKKMTDKYCPQEQTLICTKFVANETEKIDKYISGIPNNIYVSVKASKPKTLDETIELANDLMDQKLCTYAERQTDNKRKADDSSRNNHGHQQHPSKMQNVRIKKKTRSPRVLI
nr:hypothetical protein [Tanacetum cinerariifolium]